MAIENERIRTKYLILCEGKDAQNFMIQYLNSDVLSVDNRFSDDVQVMDFGGIKMLSSYIATLKNMDGYQDVTRIMVLRDAETNAEGAVDSVTNSFLKNGLVVPERCNQWNFSDTPGTAFSLFPACCVDLTNGTLEDLCWDILADERAEECRKDVQAFIGEMKNKYSDSILTFEHKCRLHTYFSVKDDFVSLKIGEAAKAKAFNWNHERLLPLRKLIEEGFN